MFTFRSLQAKLFITYSAVLILFALTISIPMFLYFRSHLAANIKGGVEQMARGFSDNLELNFITFDNITVQLYNTDIGPSGSPALIDNLDTLSQSAPRSLTEQLQAQKSVDNFFLLNTAIYKTIQQISLITLNDRVFSVPADETSDTVQPADRPALAAAADAKGTAVLVYPETGPGADASGAAFSFVRQLNWNGSPTGFLEVRVPAERLLDLHKLDAVTGSHVMILHGERLVYSSFAAEAAPDAKALLAYRGLVSQAQSGGDYIKARHGRSEFAVYDTSARTGYTVLVTVPEDKLFAPLRLFRNVSFGSVLLLILFSFAVYYALARILTHPLKKLKQALDAVKIDDGAAPIENKYKMDEIAMLNRSFQKMNVRLKDSLEEVVQFRTLQLQSHFNTLQAQINPHFMFNMLSVITGLSDGGEMRKVSEISRKLSSFLRYSIATGSPTAALQEEMAFTADYLELMKSRYLHRLSYEWSVDERLQELRLPKLTVQPLVENCIQHGMQDNERPLIVRITAAATADGAWEICIRDNGAGFEHAALEAIRGRIDAFVEGLQRHDLELSFGGMGLVSTVARLRLLLKERFEYEIGNHADFGAYVRLRGAGFPETP